MYSVQSTLTVRRGNSHYCFINDHGLRVVVSVITDISGTTLRRVRRINMVMLGQNVLVLEGVFYK